MEKNIIIASPHAYNDNLEDSLRKKIIVTRIKSPEFLTLKILEEIQPDYIFFPHWSWKIPEKILRKITNDLQIEWHNNLISPTFLGGKFTGNNHSGDKFQGISSSNVGRWKERISKNEACIIEGWLADIMTYWGYKLEYSHDDHVNALSDFYAWYNCKYFFSDSFTV